MSMSTLAPEVVVWSDAKRADLVLQIMLTMDDMVSLIGVGGPRGQASLQLAQMHDLTPSDDLRKLLIEHPPAFMLLACDEPVDVKLLQTVINKGTKVLTLEPVASSFEQIIPIKAPQGDGCLLSLPTFTLCPAWLKAGQLQDVIGRVQLASFESMGQAYEQSLHARLTEAWDVLGAFISLPETVDCSLSGPLTETPQDIRGIAGHLITHARVMQNTAATLLLSDQVAQHHRRLIILGEHGRVVMTDLTYHLYNAQGELLEETDLTDSLTSMIPPAVEPRPSLFAQLAANQWRQIINQPDQSWLHLVRQQQADNLACRLACLLSARTNVAESPGRMKILAKM